MRLLMVAILLLSLMIGNGSVYADQEKAPFDITYDLPLNGALKPNRWTQLDVTIHNRGKAFEGEAVIYHLYSNIPNVRHRISIEENEKKQFTFYVPGGEYLVDTAMKFVDNKNMVVQTLRLDKAELLQAPTIGIVSDRDSSYHFLGLVQKKNEQPHILRQIPAAKLPEESILLGSINILVIDVLKQQTLNETQAAAIEQWVKSGGVLIVSGGESYQYTQPLLKQLLPVPYKGLMSRTDLSGLKELSKETDLPADQIDTVRGLSDWVNSYKWGKGIVIVPSFDPSSEVFASWKGNSSLWNEIFTVHDVFGYSSATFNSESENQGLLYESQKIPGLNAPSLPMIAILWVVYIALTAPLLYWFLKRTDRREWAWVVIPSLSLFLTLVVFFYGKHQVAAQNMAYTVSEVKILDSALAKIDSGSSILVVNGGEFTVRTPANAYTMPNRYYRNDQVTMIFEKNTDGTLLHYENVPYLTLQQNASTRYQTNVGSFDARLYFEGEQLEGEITNNTSFDYEKLFLQIDRHRFDIGSLKRGETVQVKEAFKKVIIPMENRVEDVPPNKEANVSYSYAEQAYTVEPNFRGMPVMSLNGTTDASIDSIEVLSEDVKSSYLTHVIQQVDWQPDSSGRYTFPYGILPVNVVNSDGEVHPIQEGWKITKGTIKFALWTKPNGIDVNRIEIPLHEPPFRPFDINIYNLDKKQWEPIQKNKPIILDSTNLSTYSTLQGEVTLQISNPTGKPLQLPNPYFMVEGEATDQ